MIWVYELGGFNVPFFHWVRINLVCLQFTKMCLYQGKHIHNFVHLCQDEVNQGSKIAVLI